MTTNLTCSTSGGCGAADYCGTGTWSGPKPGDPNMGSGSIRLAATPVVGGIRVSWSWPTINGAAVSHTKLYRGTSEDFNSAVELAVVSGNAYKDEITEETTYWYWIRMVSVNGTEGDLIGPVSATSRNSAADIIEAITGEIDESVLANALRENIAKITLTRDELADEIRKRVAGNAAISVALAQLDAGLVDAVTAVHTETTERVNGQNALVLRQDTLAALNADNAAAILTEQEARVSADEAFASDVTALYAANAENAAAILNEANVRATRDTSLAQNINTVQSTLNGQISSVQQTMSTNINAVDGKVNALWTARVDVNGLVGGFGIHNDGQRVDAAFDVDRFWVGRTTNKRKPFMVIDGVTYIDSAVIREASIDTLKIRNNAVTIPQVVNASHSLPGIGKWVWRDYASGSLYMDETGMVQIQAAVRMGTDGSGWGTCGSRLLINGAVVSEGAIDTGYHFDMHSWQGRVNKGSAVTFVVQFFGADSHVRMYGATVTMLGIKR